MAKVTLKNTGAALRVVYDEKGRPVQIPAGGSAPVSLKSEDKRFKKGTLLREGAEQEPEEVEASGDESGGEDESGTTRRSGGRRNKRGR